jgi:primase-polymerase (primpol)-like protein
MVEPEETSVVRQWLSEHIPMAMTTYTTVEEVLDVVLSV